MINPPTGPTLLGVDVFLVGSILAGIAAAAMVYAIYNAVTVRDPMSRRVKALNARREELKAGIIKGSGKTPQSVLRRSDKTDKVKDTLSNMKVLQESQVKIIQQKLA